MKRPDLTDKPFRCSPKCTKCGKSRNQHRGGDGACPNGKRGPSGYTSYGPGTFTKPSKETGT